MKESEFPMKLKYEFKNHGFLCFNEAQGVYLYKKAILKGKKFKGKPYTTVGLMFLQAFFLLCCLGIVVFLFFLKSNLFFFLFCIGMGIIALLLFLYYFLLFVGYFHFKRSGLSGTLFIHEKGVTNFRDHHVSITIPWDRILLGAATYSTVTILTTGKILFFINRQQVEEIANIFQLHHKIFVDLEAKEKSKNK